MSTCALTAALCIVSKRQRRDVFGSALSVWFRIAKGPFHWRQHSAQPRSGLERRLEQVKKLLREAKFQGQALEKALEKVSDEEILDFELQRIGSSIGPDVVPLGFALLNHSCCPNARISYVGCSGTLSCIRPISAGEEICVSYINEYSDVLSRRYFLLEKHGVRCQCPRCAANFWTKIDLLHTWLCPTCCGELRDEEFRCSCGFVVSPAERKRRLQKQRWLWQLATEEMCRILKFSGHDSEILSHYKKIYICDSLCYVVLCQIKLNMIYYIYYISLYRYSYRYHCMISFFLSYIMFL